MLKSLYSGISGMHAFQTKLDVIGNNIANVNTVGFKAGRVMFSDILSQTVQGASAPVDPAAGTNPQQIGLGTQISAIDTINTAGSPETTNIPTDCAIDGQGYFKVSKDGTNFYYTRAGNFQVDSAGNLATPDGFVVYGTDDSPVKVDGAVSATIAPDGTVTFQVPGSGPDSSHIIALHTFANPGGLVKVGGNMYEESANSGTASDATQPGQNGTNALRVGALEMSNVDLTNEFAEMIVAQRGFDANSKIISTDNQILQEIVNLKQ
jgi:flagellar hook protein FlgE